MKWAKHDNTYTPTSTVVDELPAALYDCGISWGRPYYQKVELKTDRLFLLPRTATELVMEELKKFWTKKDDFAKYGVLYKRGILLYGPPGTGKTSLINLVAGEAAKKGAVSLRFKDPNSFPTAMKALREAQPARPLVVFIEDIDQWLDGWEEEVLDMLDGADQVDNVVYVATTNYLDRLPQRIVNRPSRFDRRIEIGNPEAETRAMFLGHLSNESNNPEWKQWAEKTEGLTFAHLKELFISVRILGNPFKESLEVLRAMGAELLEESSPNDDDDDCCEGG